jgi:hypothetical protein
MIATTRKQREALARKWQQDPQGLTYRQFRATVLGGWDCIMVRWCGMWLGNQARHRAGFFMRVYFL